MEDSAIAEEIMTGEGEETMAEEEITAEEEEDLMDGEVVSTVVEITGMGNLHIASFSFVGKKASLGRLMFIII